MKEKQESHEKTAHMKMEKMEKDVNEMNIKLLGIKVVEQKEQSKKLTAKVIYLERRIKNRMKEKQNATLAFGDNTSLTSFNEESFKKVSFKR